MPARQLASINAFEISHLPYNARSKQGYIKLNMDGFENDLEHPKKRRRREHKAPASARLVGDETLRGITSVVSDDLWTELVGRTSDPTGTTLAGGTTKLPS